MNLAAMLQAANQPAQETKEAKQHARLKNLLLGGPSQSAKALERYRAIMEGKGWMTRQQIENALGYASTVSTRFLEKLLSERRIERRNRGGSPVFKKREGYEWRWRS